MANKKEQNGIKMKYTGPTCPEQGYNCTLEEKLWTNIKREIDPTTGMVKNAIQECQAFYECRHCSRRIPIASVTLPADTVVTFQMMLDIRREQLNAQAQEQESTSTRSR